eukprot:SAG31_NODE_24426_length_481_cov_1.107330_1_plen_155_part_10
MPITESSTDRPPTTCTVSCAELWLPLLEDCEGHMAEAQQLTVACEEQASALMNEAPSSIMIDGLSTHSAANGLYTIERRTVGGKPCWALRQSSAAQDTWYLYAINEPHDGWAIGRSLTFKSAEVETYEDHPPYGDHAWKEVTDAHGSTETVQVVL